MVMRINCILLRATLKPGGGQKKAEVTSPPRHCDNYLRT
jgi:hypothetical protein